MDNLCKQPLVSIIIPLYNVEQFLRCCLDSVVFQTYENLEIILMDDGSTDESGKICDEYANRDNRIKVFHQKNGGQALARNNALRYVHGDFIIYIDSDDIITDNHVEHLVKLRNRYNSTLTISYFISEFSCKLWNSLLVCEYRHIKFTDVLKF